ncbi:MAG: hypothetical protein WDN45_10455 [Caulobacteraceae bacterium]
MRSGATLAAQNVSEQSVSLQVGTQKGVDMNFSSVDLTLSWTISPAVSWSRPWPCWPRPSRPTR